MKWIGLTGGLGSGKTTVANRLRELGYKVGDADVIAREVLEQSPALVTQLKDRYGKEVVGSDGKIDRKALGKIVFRSKVELDWLEAQIHPLVRSQVEALKTQWQQQGEKIAFYDVPLLFEKGLKDQFDSVVLVYSPSAEIFDRVVARDGLDETSIRERIANQIPLEKKKEMAHYVLDNDKDLPHLFNQVDELLKTLG